MMWYIIFIALLAIYMLFNMLLPSFFSSPMGAYIIKPIIWISFAILVFLIAHKEGLNIWRFKKIRRWEFGRSPLDAAILIGGFQVSLMIMLGMLFGFGNSPYSQDPIGIIINLVFIGSALLGIELSRAYFIKKGMAATRNLTLILGIVALLFMLINIPRGNLIGLSLGDPTTIAQFIGESIVPIFAMSLLASYLAYLGGAAAAIAYLGIIQGFQWFSPALPHLSWSLTALVGLVGPIVGFLLLQNTVQMAQEKSFKSKRRKLKIKDPALSWTAVAVLSLLLIFFSFGLFGVQPTVIYSGSMQPTMDVGDIVIITEVPIDTIEAGDIIQYRTASANVIHRVYEVYEEGDTKLFTTKGDANTNPDEAPILPEQITGKVSFTIPKIGWIPIFIKSLVSKIGITI